MMHLFYVIAALFLVVKLVFLVNIKTVHAGVIRHYKLRKRKKKIELEDLSYNMLAYQVIGILYLIYAVIGLMSSQCLLFALLIILGFVPKKVLVWRYIDSILSISILLFIILNKYHFHINIFNSIF